MTSSSFMDVHTIGDVARSVGRGFLIQVSASASVKEALGLMHRLRVSALPVWARPGEWIGAGGSNIVEKNEITGESEKHYIGILNVLDVLSFVAETASCSSQLTLATRNRNSSREYWMAALEETRVSSLVGKSMEGLTVWTVPQTASLDATMEVLSKGVHRVLVPFSSHSTSSSYPRIVDPITHIEHKTEASSYEMVTQTDIAMFILDSAGENESLCRVLELSVEDARAVQDCVVAVAGRMKILDAIRCLQQTGLSAAPVVMECPENLDDDPILLMGHGKHVIGTFSASDFRGYDETLLESFPDLNVINFLSKVQKEAAEDGHLRDPITCTATDKVQEVLKRIVRNRVHRVWVVKGHTRELKGVVSLTDILGAIWRECRKSFSSKSRSTM